VTGAVSSTILAQFLTLNLVKDRDSGKGKIQKQVCSNSAQEFFSLFKTFLYVVDERMAYIRRNVHIKAFATFQKSLHVFICRGAEFRIRAAFLFLI
jgi:hypothetical protein